MAKPSAQQRADKFLSQIGTAGGPIGATTAPGLVAYGAADLANQVMAGMVDEYAAQRGQGTGPAVGSPNAVALPITNNLSANYLNLALPGSPLPMHGLLGAHKARTAQLMQDNILAAQQQFMNSVLPPTGALPLSPMQMAANAAKNLQKKTSKQRSGQR